MSIAPEGENIRKAVRWISSERCDHPETPLAELVDRACMMFNLSPLEALSLSRTIADRDGDGRSAS